jgi:hypothetical protein
MLTNSSSDRRAAPRFEMNQPAHLTLLNDPPESMPVIIVDGHFKGMKINLPIQVPLNQAIKIEVGEFLILGEVCYCGPNTSGTPLPYSAGIIVSQFLSGVGDLRHLLDALQREEKTAAEERRVILPLNGR